MNKLEITGGAMIGNVKATWPLAKLIVTNDRLDLNAGIIGNLAFHASDVVSIAPYRGAMGGRGIFIEHTIASYNSQVIFWTKEDPAIVIRGIEATGFLHQVPGRYAQKDPAITSIQNSGAFPVKKSVAIAVVVLWNVLLLSDMARSFLGKKEFRPGIGSLTAIGLLFLLSLSLLVSAKARSLLLKDGRTLSDIDRSVYLFLFISGFMFIGFLFMFFLS